MPEFIIDVLKAIHIDDDCTYRMTLRESGDHLARHFIKSPSVEHSGQAISCTEFLQLRDQFAYLIILVKSIKSQAEIVQPHIMKFIEDILILHLNYGISEYLVIMVCNHNIIYMAPVGSGLRYECQGIEEVLTLCVFLILIDPYNRDKLP